MSTTTLGRSIAIVMISLMAATQSVQAQPAAATKPKTEESKPFKPEELEQLAAPIALYPDSVVAQVLMASTYPVEIVQAERWQVANKTLKGDALAAALNKQTWDPSVKSLIDFPQVLDMMSKQLDWTIKLGDAFIADQAAIMSAVQRLRAKAKAAGNLKDTAEQKIIIEQAPPQTIVVQSAPPPVQIIKIEPTSPTVVYVPVYSPTVVYGVWPYPAYPPPPPYYPPGYVAGGRALSFAAGVAVGAAWGHAWGGCNWGGGEVDIDVNRNTTFNQNINRESYKADMQNRQTNRQTGTGTGAGRQGSGNQFQHDPSHRKGASYRDQASASKVGLQSGRTNSLGGGDAYRGRSADSARGASPSQQGGANRGASPSQQGGANRSASPSQQGGANRAASPSPTSSNRGGAYSGAGESRSTARAESSRGQASRSSASPSRSSSSGGSRGGGGGRSRGGGGGRR